MRSLNLTPVSNTGVNKTVDKEILEVGIDWFTATFPAEYFMDVRKELETFLGEEFTPLEHGMGFYRSSWRSPTGARLAADQVHGNTAQVSLSGSVCKRFETSAFVEFFYSLGAYSLRPSRIDISIDDYSKKLDLEKVEAAVLRGEFYGLRKYKIISSFSRGDDGPAKTISFGARGDKGSGRCMTFYDKTKESDGAIDAIRLETSLYGKMARSTWEVMTQLSLSGDALAPFLFSLATDPVDFRTIDPNGRRDRTDRLDWWEEFLGGHRPLRLSPGVVAKTIERSVKWLKKTVSATLVTVFNALSALDAETFFAEMITEGEEKLKPYHYALIKAYRLQHGICLQNS